MTSTARAQTAAAKAPPPMRRSGRHFRPGGRISVVSRPQPAKGAAAHERKEGSP